MNWLKNALTSSIGRKWVMGLTGLLLIVFVVIHLSGNLLLYVGFEAYNHYAHALHTNPTLIYIAEIGLLVLFALHIFIALHLSRDNRRARLTPYVQRKSKQGNTAATPSATMFVTGAIVLAFILLHLADFRFHLRNVGLSEEEPFDKALRLLQDPITASVYVLGSLLLGWHLLHGFQSTFQSLGFRHAKYSPFLRTLGVILAVVIGLGFASFPIWAYLKKMGVLA